MDKMKRDVGTTVATAEAREERARAAAERRRRETAASEEATAEARRREANTQAARVPSDRPAFSVRNIGETRGVGDCRSIHRAGPDGLETVGSASCIEIEHEERGNHCGEPDSHTVSLRNVCAEALYVNKCIRWPSGKWDCGSSTLAAGERGEYWSCHSTGQFWVDAVRTNNGCSNARPPQ